MERKGKFCSCRLAVHHETGRVQWCVGQQREWPIKLRRLVFLPIVLLPIVIVIIFLTKYVAAANMPQMRDGNYENNKKRIAIVEAQKLIIQPEEFYQDSLRILEDERLQMEFDGVYNEIIRERENESKKRIKRSLNYFEVHRHEANKRPFFDGTDVFWTDSLDLEAVRMLQSKVMKKYMDVSVNPCNDFYHYACGKWKKYYTIPPERNSYDTFEILRENLDKVLRTLLEENTTKANAKAKYIPFKKVYAINDSIDDYLNDTADATVKVKYFYQSCMNEEYIKKRGQEPIHKLLANLGGWPFITPSWNESNFDLIWLMAQLRLFNNDLLIAEWVGPDLKNSDEYIIHLDQTTLGLPTKDYFISSENLKYVEAYKNFIITVAELLGAPKETVYKDTEDLIAFETKIAEIMVSHEDRRHVDKIYLRTTIGALSHYFPQLDWIRYFTIILGKNMALEDPVACFCSAYLHRLIALLSKTENRVVANYLLWRFVRHRVNNLDERFLMAKQRFYYTLFGKKKAPMRWQFCIQQTNANMGMALGKLFVEKYFDQQSKEDTLKMTEQLQQAFQDILSQNKWIDETTKQYAQMKLRNINLKIGYPDFIVNLTELNERYRDVQVQPNYFFENTLSILRHLTRFEQRKIGTEANRTLWGTSPAIVNAYYSRNKNQIMFPAGILQPPFYHRHFPKALNFGGIGVVIGHEITHGFDDKGRLFDQKGNLDYWWKEPSILEFHNRAQCMIEQYSTYVLPEANARINGYLTQGENIADNGGLKQSFWAYKKWLRNHPNDDETLPELNLTGPQLFFLNFAQIWCGIQRAETAKTRLQSAVHAPGIFRVLGTLRNSPDFAKTFNCPKNSPMNPLNKCVLW